MRRTHVEIIEQSPKEYSIHVPALGVGSTRSTKEEALNIANLYADELGLKGYDEVTVYLYSNDVVCSSLRKGVNNE